MRKLLLIIIIFFTARSYATTITVFSDGSGLCRYVITDDDAKPVAAWTGDCLENPADAKRVEISEGNTLWNELKRLDVSLKLQYIRVINTMDESVIAKLKALSIPVIKVDKHAVPNFFRINNSSDGSIEKQEAQDYNSSRSNKANSIATVNNGDTSNSNKKNSIATAQDYNSSRSNKANSISTAQDYNSSRSNKANSIATLNNSDSSGDGKTNSIATAQDYNSSRSNKANSISTAQDYNSSRSNKANSIATINKSDSSGDGKTNSISTAQDYNSSRSNKANSISTAQDYNSSRSNKANSIATVNNSDSSDGNKTNSISSAQDYNSSRSNKANSINTVNNSDSLGGDKTNSIATAQDYNSSRSNKANSISTAQDYNSSRSNKAGIILSTGFAFDNKNSYMKNGFVINAAYHIPVKNSFGVEVGIGFWSNHFSYSPSSVFPKEYKNEIEKSINNNKWNNISVSAGPSIMIGKGKYSATIYTKAAVLFTKIPEETIGGDNTVALFDGNKTSFVFNPGLRLSYSMNSKIRVFINPELLTSLNKNIPYTEKDISKATNADGKFNPDTYSSLPLNKKYMAINLIGISAGLKIAL